MICKYTLYSSLAEFKSHLKTHIMCYNAWPSSQCEVFYCDCYCDVFVIFLFLIIIPLVLIFFVAFTCWQVCLLCWLIVVYSILIRVVVLRCFINIVVWYGVVW